MTAPKCPDCKGSGYLPPFVGGSDPYCSCQVGVDRELMDLDAMDAMDEMDSLDEREE